MYLNPRRSHERGGRRKRDYHHDEDDELTALERAITDIERQKKGLVKEATETRTLSLASLRGLVGNRRGWLVNGNDEEDINVREAARLESMYVD